MISCEKKRHPSKHVAIADALSRRISSGQLVPGAQLPTESDLMGSFGVSRLTVRRALQNLMQDGLVVGHQGKGTFVNNSRVALASNILFIHPGQSGISYPYTSLILDGIRNFSQNTTISFRIEMIGMADIEKQSASDTTIEEFVTFGKCDGIIALPYIHPEAIRRLLKKDIPVVLIGSLYRDFPEGVIRVGIQSSVIYPIFFEYAKAKGWKKIGAIGGDLMQSPCHYDFLLQASEQAGVAFSPGQYEVAAWGANGGERAAERLLARNPDLDVIYAADDLLALGVLHALWKRGINVPGQVAVVGAGNMLEDHSHCGLTTVDLQLKEHGILAAELLQRKLEGKPVNPLNLMQPYLLERSTT